MGIYTINLGGTLTRTAARYPDRTVFVSHEGDRLTYCQLDRLSERFASALLRMGFRKGDHIAILSLNCNEQMIAFFGIFKMGGVVVPINARLAAPEMKWVIDHSDAVALIFSKEFEERVKELGPELEGVRSMVMLDQGGREGTLAFQELLEKGAEGDPLVDVFGDDMAFLVYTAGTTGKPKGVLLTHNSCIWNCINWAYTQTFREGDYCLQVFPLYHVAAIGNILTYVYLGGSIYLKRTFDPRDCMETIERERITRWAAAPTVFNMLLQLPNLEKYDSSSLTLLGSGAAIMPVETRRRLRDIFSKAWMFDNYGMTEAAGGITTLTPLDSQRKEASVGTPLIAVEMRVVDENDSEVATGQVGEVVFRGNNLMKGYYKDPDATREAMRNGWMHTGDLGRLDEEGFLYIVDRKKDMIITGAENVYPREVEEVLYAHSKIAEAAVIGIPDPKWGEAITAVVVLNSGAEASQEEIIDFCRGKIAGFKCPKSVKFLEELPKNAAGKILKRVLRERYQKTDYGIDDC
ncbi:MAG: long-chain fatty acid--CoA ligase [Pseudomonadota bacterium]